MIKSKGVRSNLRVGFSCFFDSKREVEEGVALLSADDNVVISQLGSFFDRFIETMMDRLAVALDLDPVEFRMRNANIPNEETPQGLKITSCGLKECLEAVAARAEAGSQKLEVRSQSPEARLPTFDLRPLTSSAGSALLQRSTWAAGRASIEAMGVGRR